MFSVSILLIGELSRPEFQGVDDFLESLGQVRFFSDAETAANGLASGEIVSDLTVIAQSFPGEFSQQAIDRLRVASPLSRMVAILGSWCEGEMRSGQPWPTVNRLYWHQRFGRIGREIMRLAGGDCPSWGLPLTATEEERLLAATPYGIGLQPVEGETGWKPDRRAGLIGISARRFESFDWLSAACRQREYATLWLTRPPYPHIEGLTAVFLDGSDFHGAELGTLRQISTCYQQTRRIALTNFPRIEDRRRLLQAGATMVLSSPVSVDDLFEAIEDEKL
jgi:hypothetical protein